MSNHVKDKVVVITGAGSGFGRLVAQKSAVLGAKVVASDISDTALEETVTGIKDAGGEATGYLADVTNSGEMHALAAEAVKTFGRIDVMVNNAGVMPLAFYSDHEAAQSAWDECIDINIKGVLNGIQAVYDHMIQQGRGHVVNLSSIYGNYPVAGAGVYGATKAAVNFLSESLRMESQGRIKVTIIRPTGVPGTGLGSGIINPEALSGILGHNMATYTQLAQAQAAGELPAEYTDLEHIDYFALKPDDLAEQIMYAINQPWGIAVGDLTVRASGDRYIL